MENYTTLVSGVYKRLQRNLRRGENLFRVNRHSTDSNRPASCGELCSQSIGQARARAEPGTEVMSRGSTGKAGKTGELARLPEKGSEQHHEGLADVILCDDPLLFCSPSYDLTEIRITKDH